MTKIPLRDLMNEAAEMHKKLNCESRQQARQNIVAVAHAIKARYDYQHAKEVLNNM
jgi:hypothetical protein